jgi:hypothetical protein
VVGHRYSDAAQVRDHVGGDREVGSFHPHLEINNRHDRSKLAVRSKKLILRWCLADTDCNDTRGTRSFDTRQVPPQGTKFVLFGVELFRCG